VRCSKCNDGEMRSLQTRFSKRLGVLTRKRVCNKCKYTITTVEINRDTWEKDNKFMTAIIRAIGEYNLSTDTIVQE
jgi:transcriptional regulator NrdR family protein